MVGDLYLDSYPQRQVYYTIKTNQNLTCKDNILIHCHQNWYFKKINLVQSLNNIFSIKELFPFQQKEKNLKNLMKTSECQDKEWHLSLKLPQDQIYPLAQQEVHLYCKMLHGDQWGRLMHLWKEFYKALDDIINAAEDE